MVSTFLLLAALATQDLSERDALTLDHVESYAAPEQGQVPAVFGEEGVIVFDVYVGEDGTVEHFDVVSETSMARPVAAEALQKWRFRVDHGEKPAVRRVTFVFEKPRDTECDHSLKAWYESPLTLHVQPAKARGMCLPRVNGEIPPKECQVHHVAMSVERLPLRATGPPPLPEEDSYRASLKADYGSHLVKDFPNAWQFAGTGCIIPTEQYAEAYICPKCREARDAWLKAHPGFAP